MIVLEFPAPTDAWSINQERKMHWTEARQIAREWRLAGKLGWRMLPIGEREAWEPRRCEVEITLPVKDGRRRDPMNWFGPVKSLIDGLVDGGVWPDDTPEWVRVVEPVLNVGGPVRIVLRPI